MPKVRWGDNEGQKNFYRAHQLLLQGGKWWTKNLLQCCCREGLVMDNPPRFMAFKVFHSPYHHTPPIFEQNGISLAKVFNTDFPIVFFIVHHLYLIRRLFCHWDIYKESQCSAAEESRKDVSGFVGKRFWAIKLQLGGSLVDLVVTLCQTCGAVQYWIHGVRCHIYGVVYYTTSVVVWFEKLVDRNLAEQSGLVTLQPSQHPIIPLNWRIPYTMPCNNISRGTQYTVLFHAITLSCGTP